MSTTTDQGTQKAQPVRNVQGIAAALQLVVTVLAGINWAMHPSWASVLVTLLPALGTLYSAIQAYFLPQKVVPLEDTAKYVDAQGNMVAGPAAPPVQAVQLDQPSDVTEEPRHLGE